MYIWTRHSISVVRKDYLPASHNPLLWVNIASTSRGTEIKNKSPLSLEILKAMLTLHFQSCFPRLHSSVHQLHQTWSNTHYCCRYASKTSQLKKLLATNNCGTAKAAQINKMNGSTKQFIHGQKPTRLKLK